MQFPCPFRGRNMIADVAHCSSLRGRRGMIRILKTLCISAVATGIAGAAFAADVTAKRPDPSSIHFIQGLETGAAAGTDNVVGHLFFHRELGAINVEYKPSQWPDPSATKIVMLCTDNHARVEIPINQD